MDETKAWVNITRQGAEFGIIMEMNCSGSLTLISTTIFVNHELFWKAFKCTLTMIRRSIEICALSMHSNNKYKYKKQQSNSRACRNGVMGERVCWRKGEHVSAIQQTNIQRELRQHTIMSIANTFSIAWWMMSCVLCAYAAAKTFLTHTLPYRWKHAFHVISHWIVLSFCHHVVWSQPIRSLQAKPPQQCVSIFVHASCVPHNFNVVETGKCVYISLETSALTFTQAQSNV